RTRVDHRPVRTLTQAVHRIDQLALAVVLFADDLDGQLRRNFIQVRLDLGERCAAVKSRLPRPEQVQVRTVQNRDLQDFLKPSSQARKSSVSSISAARDTSPGGGDFCSAVSP